MNQFGPEGKIPDYLLRSTNQTGKDMVELAKPDANYFAQVFRVMQIPETVSGLSDFGLNIFSVS